MDQLNGLSSVRAELYRVQDAVALTGQRLTSTSLTMTLPQTIPDLTIAPPQVQGVAYAPTEAMILAAQAGEEEAALSMEPEAPAAAGAYGDTGAADTAEASLVDYAARPDSLALAVQIDFTLDPATDANALAPTVRAGLYQAKRCDAASGRATLYAVARAGNLNGVTLTGDFSDIAPQTTVTAEAIRQVDHIYATAETALDVSATAERKSTPSRPSGGFGGGSSPDPSGGAEDPAETAPAQKLPFADVPAGSWYEDAVAFVYSKGMMMGTSSTQFAPEETTSRAMIVTILWRLEGSPAHAASGRNDYTDVPGGQWYTEAIRWASEQGIVNGLGDGTFAPDDPITREQMAAILYRYASAKGYDLQAQGDLSGFADAAAVSPYAVEALGWANGVGLINGMGGGILEPQGNAKRCQAAAIFYRLCTAVQP